MLELVKDNLRRLTANYNEEEYNKWLHETPQPIDKRHYWDSIKGDEHIKDIACDLACVADDTGYEAEFLYQMFDESVEDRMELGEDFIEARKHAFSDVTTISYERDW